LNPAKRKELSKITAESLGMDHLIVDDVVAFFYRTVQKKLSSMNHPSINVPNLGTFVLKKQRVQKKLEKYNSFLERIDASESMSMYETTVDVKSEIEKYNEVLSIMDSEVVRKKEIQKLKEKYLDNVE
jgi:nucleoid DNA-binding protein